jgi:enediyne polyketide synthase
MELGGSGMQPAIAIVGLACQYPDITAPGELWENVLAQRRAFRRLPAERLCLADYYSTDRQAADSVYATEAAVIEGYDFDRLRFRVSGAAYRAADLTHWLALDVAARALNDAGFAEAAELPREMTGVFLGNTLTGEFSRAELLRLRWPYVRRVLEAALRDEDWTPARRQRFLTKLEQDYKAPFPPIGEESLAGGLSNTIAGRICNHFDLKGGGYTLDGACASSLLAVAQACAALAAGDLDVALAGGVDLSLDPFELVGFAKAGALAAEQMRVYDARSAGFWPGEGCGMVALMRDADAVAQGRRVYALIRGWGISSDGQGGLTRPEIAGQRLALLRAYRRAGFGIETVGYFEGHGTGTSVGDATELKTLNQARREATGVIAPAVVGSIKANIGHTKAAAGVAGLIKATLALQHQVLPPMTGCEEPHPELCGAHSTLRIARTGELWPEQQPLRAGVSAMGFGGINVHLALEGVSAVSRRSFSPREQMLLSSPQDTELLLFSAENLAELQKQLAHLLTFSNRLSVSEVGDLSAHLAERLELGAARAAIVAANPSELTCRLEKLLEQITAGTKKYLDFRAGIFLNVATTTPRLGFLFPGQASPTHLSGEIWRRRFLAVEELYQGIPLTIASDERATEIAQPAIIRASLAGLRVLQAFGLQAENAVGHSLGELAALCWAGALTEDAVLRIAAIRGRAMMEKGDPAGRMAAIEATALDVTRVLNGGPVVISGLNAPGQTVIAGEQQAVTACLARLRAAGYRAALLPVTRAFHSPLVAGAVSPLAQQLSKEELRPLQRQVISTVTGLPLLPQENLRSLLQRQITAPVQFIEAVNQAAAGLDLLLEVGPGEILSGLVSQFVTVPVCSLDAGSASLGGLWKAVGAAFVLSAPINTACLAAERFTRPFNLNWQPKFFANPCESAPLLDAELLPAVITTKVEEEETKLFSLTSETTETIQSPLALLRQLIAGRTELPPAAIGDDDRLLGDLHLNSITVSQLIITAARALGLPPPLALTDYSTVTIREAALALEELVNYGGAVTPAAHLVTGVDTWVRTFTEEYIERPRPQFLIQQESLLANNQWRIIKPDSYPLAEALAPAFCELPGEGVIVCLPPDPDERHLWLLLAGARAVLEKPDKTRFVLVQHGGGGAAFARTLYLEAPQSTVCVVDVPLNAPQAAAWVAAEAGVAHGYSEAHYDLEGIRREPVLRLLPQGAGEKQAALPLEKNDVLLVTGGGKGIAAECALDLARRTGVRLVLLGRARPEDDPELAENLRRFSEHQVTFRYCSVDVTDASALRQAVTQAEKSLGPITAILHGAGLNYPRPLHSLSEEAFRQTLAPKLDGARNLLAIVDPQKLKLFIAFGSLIARTGMRGEADYAVANEWLSRLLESWQTQHPHCRCLAVEWSVWSGVGMGERLGRVDALLQQGITPITPDVGIESLRSLLAGRQPKVPVIVTGRYGNAPTLRLENNELPLLRFLEEPLVYYPGIELVIEAQLSIDTDPYLQDHVLQGQPIFPGVLGLEAVAQAAVALLGRSDNLVFEQVKFQRPIVVPENASLRIRLASLARSATHVEVVLRSEETSFQFDHFSAICRVGKQVTKSYLPSIFFNERVNNETALSLEPQRDLYNQLLFQRGRFARLGCYYYLRATECEAALVAPTIKPWFGTFLPGELILNDPGALDAAIHSIQACIPQATLLPVGIDRLSYWTNAALPPYRVAARERSRTGDLFIYDLEIRDATNKLLSCCEGLQLHQVGAVELSNHRPIPLLSAYLERCIKELSLTQSLALVLTQNSESERQRRGEKAIKSLSGEVVILRRPDGKPELKAGDERVTSIAHCGELTLAVVGCAPLACDLECVIARLPEEWRALLGAERYSLADLVAKEASEELTLAATRVWCVMECLKKSGAAVAGPITLLAVSSDGWVSFQSGALLIITYSAQVQGDNNKLALAVLLPAPSQT